MDTHLKKIISDLVDYSETGEHSTFCFIRNWPDYISLRKRRRTLKSVIKILQTAIDSTFKNYCKAIPDGSAQFIKLLACNVLQSALEFYQEEYRTQTDMIDEYEMYLFKGNLLKSFLYEQRPESELWDHRGL
jgi:hypothetical protein